jgi:hypothetical protein
MGDKDSSVSVIPWPILVHGQGLAHWANQAFVGRFGIDPAAGGMLKVRELMWCLGIQDPLAGLIASGAVFPELDVSLGRAEPSALSLRQMPLPGGEGEAADLVMLVMAGRGSHGGPVR